jgi:hypothetical protein
MPKERPVCIFKDRRQKTEDRRLNTEDGSLVSEICYLLSCIHRKGAEAQSKKENRRQNTEDRIRKSVV